MDEALKKATLELNQLETVVFTQAPVSFRALLVGTCFAKSLAMSLNIPLFAEHHMQAHVLSILIENPNPPYPSLCLTVSGGHTQIVLCIEIKIRVRLYLYEIQKPFNKIFLLVCRDAN